MQVVRTDNPERDMMNRANEGEQLDAGENIQGN